MKTLTEKETEQIVFALKKKLKNILLLSGADAEELTSISHAINALLNLEQTLHPDDSIQCKVVDFAKEEDDDELY